MLRSFSPDPPFKQFRDPVRHGENHRGEIPGAGRLFALRKSDPESFLSQGLGEGSGRVSRMEGVKEGKAGQASLTCFRGSHLVG